MDLLGSEDCCPPAFEGSRYNDRGRFTVFLRRMSQRTHSISCEDILCGDLPLLGLLRGVGGSVINQFSNSASINDEGIYELIDRENRV